ncbi:glycogen synthase kinase-3 alpha [Anaeramoeba flamelloides]|uniref:Glycogen synthase kinase-3 alpha n=1 Tax=Anaeramoeba flamelloides TaxID=1746091 RepID=A0AAV7ZG69_9EUKA|nr:glycogen synthase kinase-3 alpha [Anaeramoeba flamelloides]
MSKILTQQTVQTNYTPLKVLGNGTFGVVYKARSNKDRQIVAMKKVSQKRKYKNQELEMMKLIKHRNVVKLLNHFITKKKSGKTKYLTLVLEYIPKTIGQLTYSYTLESKSIPLILVKVYLYQILRAIATIHRLGICHRDIKPQNLLIIPKTGELRVCDFGSAKRLEKGVKNHFYICSRFYRAPELLFSSTNYTNKIDLWAIGCVFGEMLINRPLFSGQSGVKQLVKIIQLMGTPTQEEIKAMNPNYSNFNLPQIKRKPWHKILQNDLDQNAIDLISKLLQYNPNKRIDPLEACAHPFFDELRDPNTLLPNNQPLPELFDFDSDELNSVDMETRKNLIPSHIIKPQNLKKKNY